MSYTQGSRWRSEAIIARQQYHDANRKKTRHTARSLSPAHVRGSNNLTSADHARNNNSNKSVRGTDRSSRQRSESESGKRGAAMARFGAQGGRGSEDEMTIKHVRYYSPKKASSSSTPLNEDEGEADNNNNNKKDSSNKDKDKQESLAKW